MKKSKLFTDKVLPTVCFLLAAFLLGRAFAGEVHKNYGIAGAGKNRITGGETINGEVPGGDVAAASGKAAVSDPGRTWGLLFTENWGLGFGTSGSCPAGNSSAEELKEYNAYYVGDTAQKKIYLTFDCGAYVIIVSS